MTEATLERHALSCERKKLRFRSKAETKQYIKYRGKHFRRVVEPYYCTACGYWHIGGKQHVVEAS